VASTSRANPPESYFDLAGNGMQEAKIMLPMDPAGRIQTQSAKADRGALRLYFESEDHSWLGGADYDLIASMAFDDLEFTCNGQEELITAYLNLRIRALSSSEFIPDDPSDPATDPYVNHTSLVLSGAMGSTDAVLGQWLYSYNNGNAALETTGIFGDVEDSGELEGIFTTSGITVETNVPTKLTLSLRAVVATALLFPGELGSTRAFLDLRKEGRGVYFPGEIDVFTLPEGCTCDSASAGIARNKFDTTGVRTESASWGSVKALYH
jgi:hypothetical protein